MSGTVLGTRDKAVNQKDKARTLRWLTTQLEQTDTNRYTKEPILHSESSRCCEPAAVPTHRETVIAIFYRQVTAGFSGDVTFEQKPEPNEATRKEQQQ